MGGNVNRRWFAIEPLPRDESADSDNNDNLNQFDIKLKEELVLCYYKTASSKDKSGWIFLSDVTSVTDKVEDNGNAPISWIHVCHPSRTFKLRGESPIDHSLWLTTLKQVCNLQTEENVPVDNEDKRDNLNCVLSSRNLFQPAAATYEKENHFSFESKNSIDNMTNVDHEAEIDFMRRMANSQLSNDNKPRKKIYHHNSKVTEEEDIATKESSILSPSYNEMVTNGIEQHTVLSSYRNGSWIGSDTFPDTDKTDILSKEDCPPSAYWSSNGDFERKGHRSSNSEKDLPSVDAIFDRNIDHRFHRNLKANVADETICKRLGRAILSPKHTVSDESKSANESFDFKSHNDSHQHDEHMGLGNCTVTMVERFSDDVDSYNNDSFATSNSSPHVEDKMSESCNSNDGIEQDYGDRIFQASNYFPSPGKIYVANDWEPEESPPDSNPNNNHKDRVSFETDCSYIADSNFADDDWDA